MAKQLLYGATSETAIIVVSAPSVFIQLKNLIVCAMASQALKVELTYQNSGEHPMPTINLLEFDHRFGALKEFIHYDFNSPFTLPKELRGKFDSIICDPPFLSEECQTKGVQPVRSDRKQPTNMRPAAMTVRWLSKQPPGKQDASRVIICSGERMDSLIHKVYPGCKTTTFEPTHEKSRLHNEFRCYANFEGDAWKWR